MQFKNIDSLSITECCEHLNIRREDLPKVLQELENLSEVDQLVLDRLITLLNADKSCFMSCSTIEQYEKYLSTWKDGLHENKANAEIARLKAVKAELDFYNNNKSSISGCEEYLKKYPNGKYVKEAKGIIENKRRITKIILIICAIIIFIITLVICLINYSPASYINISNDSVIDMNYMSIDEKGETNKLSILTDAIEANIDVEKSSDSDWIKVNRDYSILTIESEPNYEVERSAVVTINVYSSFFGNKYNCRSKKITINQKSGLPTYLKIYESTSKQNNISRINFDKYGKGSINLMIETDGLLDPQISTNVSWITYTRNVETKGNKRITRVSIGAESNRYGDKVGTIEINCGEHKRTIEVTQESGYAKRLDVSPENNTFSYNGGNKSITVDTDGIWYINERPSWISTTTNNNSITLSVEENRGTYRNGYITIKSGEKEKRINVSQAGKSATRLSVSIDNISYSYSGGTRTITVSTDGEWQISTGTAGWGHTSISGNTITLRVDENTSSSSRTDYFVIKSGSKEKRINISQGGKPATRLSVSTENVSFGKDGGRSSITVSTNGEWRIGVGTASWAHTSVSGNTITLRVDENNSGDERTDYFTVVAGDKDVRINITQAGGPSAEVNDIRVEHNVKRTGYNSVMGPWGWQQVPYTYNVMRIYVDFKVHNMKGKTIRVCAFFYDEDGDEMTTSNNQFRAPDGQVTVQKTDNSTYESTKWTDFVLEIPYGVMRKGDNKFDIQIQDNRGNTLTTSSYIYFSVN